MKSIKFQYFLSHCVLIFVSMLAIYPVLWVLKMALSPGDSFDVSPNPFPSEISTEHFEKVLGLGESGSWAFGRQFWNSLIVSGATTLISLGISLSAAYGFSRLRFPGRDVGLLALMLTQIFPGVVMLVPLYIILDFCNLLDTLSGLCLVYCATALPFCTWMLRGYFDSLPVEMEEAAVIDGASRFTIFWYLILPLARPAIAVTALFSFMTAWNEFILAATLLGDSSLFTLPVALQQHVGEFQTQWGSFAAGAVVTSLPIMILFYALQRHLVGGLTGGSVKG